jgi:hypothetical protein
MESKHLHSVQDEQFSKAQEIAENTQENSLSEKSEVTADAPINKLNDVDLQNQSPDVINEITEEIGIQHHEDIVPDEFLVPSELIEEDENDDLGIHNQPSIDYSVFSKEELVATAARLINEKPVESLKSDFDSIKIQFYKKHKADYDKLRKQFIDEGGLAEDFVAETDVLEERLKDILKKYKDVKAEFLRNEELKKNENLKIKRAIIEDIKVLINSSESLNDTFHQFRELQKKWRSIGLVPQSEVNNLWENYNHHVEKFYDYIKINKELRDLDFKKNFEAKISLCEKAEELLMEPSVIKSFKQLQEYHNKWREIGPVPHEMRADIWNRFKDVTSKINKRHQEYFETLKASQEKNLEAKTNLCEKCEAILSSEIKTMKEWEEKSNELIEIQNVWKTIGFAPRKDNTKIYQRFRAACDNFFAKKRDFYGTVKEEQNNNLQLKLDLCIQAEAIKDSTEWKKSTEDLINIQKRWKEIGPVPRRMSDQIWKRFRAACDAFFNNKSAYFANIDSKYEDNLKQKIALIDEIEHYNFLDNVEENFSNLKEYQRRWAEIGFVPMKQKEEVQNRYRKSIDKLFDSLKIDDGKRKVLRFKNKIEQMPHNRKTEMKIDRERDKLIVHLKKLENDIVLWENNIGFFAKSKNAEAMIKEVQNKIDSAKAEIKTLEEKIRLIDNMANE